jgi:hypothetical protein
MVRLGTISLAPRLGPTFSLPDAKLATRIAREAELVHLLVEQFPKHDSASFTLPSRITNWMPFHWLGFRQTTRYSYVIDASQPLEDTWSGMAEATRRAIRKAQANLDIAEASAPTLWSLTKSSFGHQGRRSPYDTERLAAAVHAAQAHSSGLVLAALDSQGNAHAGAFFVWDDQRCYYLVGGADPDLRSSGAMSLVLWNGIRLAHERGLVFDFEGSMIAPIERFFRGFGGSPEPYSHVVRTSRRLAVGLAVRSLLGREAALVATQRSSLSALTVAGRDVMAG